MTRLFVQCRGKAYCAENETGCRTCQRSLEEIQATRQLIDELANFVVDMDYRNMDEFMMYVLSKVQKKVVYLQEQKREAIDNGYH